MNFYKNPKNCLYPATFIVMDIKYSITLPCFSFMFIEMIFIHYHSCVMFIIKSMNIYNDLMNYNKIIIQ